MSQTSAYWVKSRTKPPFKPTDAQINTAKRRILCALNTYEDGRTPIEHFDDAVDLLCIKVYNRGKELGGTRKEFRKTIRRALLQLIYDEQKVEVCAESGVIRLLVSVESKHRHHNQKYVVRQTRYA